MSQPVVLITGAVGRIGSHLVKTINASPIGFSLRLTHHSEPTEEQKKELHGDWQIGDLSKHEDVKRLCKGVHTIIHLGGDPDPHADFNDSLLNNNFKGTYNVYNAAAEEGVKRVIYASSIQAVHGYEDGIQVRVGMPTRPLNMYGVSKCFGENTGAVYAYSHNLSVIAVRIGWVVSREELSQKEHNFHDLSHAVTYEDMSRLLICCVKAQNIKYAIVNGLGLNFFPKLEMHETKRLLGYDPKDDPFQIAGVLHKVEPSNDSQSAKDFPKTAEGQQQKEKHEEKKDMRNHQDDKDRSKDHEEGRETHKEREGRNPKKQSRSERTQKNENREGKNRMKRRTGGQQKERTKSKNKENRKRKPKT